MLSAPHMIADGFKQILAIGMDAGIQFKQLLDAQNAQASAPVQSAPAQAGATAAPKAAAAPEPEPVEEAVSMGGLFD